METINHVFLSGNVVGSPREVNLNGEPVTRFSVKTLRSLGKGKDKIKSEEFHEIRIKNPGTIAQYLKEGKSVIIQGRSMPSSNEDVDYVLATSITFPS